MSFFDVFLWLLLICWKIYPLSASCNKHSYQLSFSQDLSSDTYVKYTEEISSNLAQWSLCFWAKMGGQKLDQIILTYYNDAGYYAYGRTLSNKRAYCFQPYGYDLQSNTDVPIDRWFHMCCIRDDTNQALYINGVKDAGCNGCHSQPPPSGGMFMLGKNPYYLLQHRWHGHITEVQVWDRAVNLTEVEDLANCRSSEEGNILSWGRSDMEFYGDLDFSNFQLPCEHCKEEL